MSPPKSTWTKGKFRNIAIHVSEYHDKELFKRLFEVHKKSEEAYAKARKMEGQSREKAMLFAASRHAKEEMRICVVARILSALGNGSSEEQQTANVTRVTIYDGKNKDQRILRADVAMMSSTV